MFSFFYLLFLSSTVSPLDPSIEYKWFDVGMLDYDDEMKSWLVQKVNNKGRILDKNREPVVNGGVQEDGMFVSCIAIMPTLKN